MKDKKTETYIYRGLGFPVKLVNAPFRKVIGEWVLDVNFNKLQMAVLHALLYKPAPLTGDELKFIRKFLKLSTTQFGKIFGVSHVAVLKWENSKTQANLSTDACIRLYVTDHLKIKDKEFRHLYHIVSPENLAQNKKESTRPISVDLLDELKSA